MQLSIFFAITILAMATISISARQNPTIYEISTRPFLQELTQRYGRPITKLSQIPTSELEKIRDLGADYVWFMGVWQLGEFGLNHDRTSRDLNNGFAHNLPGYTKEDVIGSPYAVVQYTCNPEIGTDDDIRALRKTLNSLKLKLMLDFVPNHMAFDCPQMKTDIDMFIRAPKDQQPPQDQSQYFSNGVRVGGDEWDKWDDVAQLNYWNPKTFAFMKNNLLKVASMCDGIRTDMSMLIMNDIIYQNWRQSLDSWGFKRPKSEFWVESIEDVKARYPGTLFMAEVYWNKEWDLMQMGFDFVYEKSILDTLATFNLDNIKTWIRSNSPTQMAKSLHFVENHDEPRAIEKFGTDYKSVIGALISQTLPGAKFINHGQLEGLSHKLDVHLRRAQSEKGSEYCKWFYSRLIPIINRDVFHNNSKWTWLNPEGSSDSWRFMAWSVSDGKNRVLVVVNFSDAKGYTKVKLADAQGAAGDQVKITELINNNNYERSAREIRESGLEVIVDAWNAQVFAY